MSLATRTISILDGVGLRRSAALLRALHREGTYSLDGTRHKRLNVSRGLVRLCRDPNARYEILTAINNTRTYVAIHPEHRFATNEGTPQTKRVGKLISNGLPAHKKVKVFDGACNDGYLAKHIENLERYIGMDFLSETIEDANREVHERFKDTGCNDFQFVVGDICDPTSYEEIPKDNNVVVCTGVVGHFRPRYIPSLLNNLNGILSNEEDARIYLGCPVFSRELIGYRSVFSDDGMDFIKTGKSKFSGDHPWELVRERTNTGGGSRYNPTHGLLYRSYDPYQFIDFIQRLGYEIDFENSDLEQLTSIDYKHKTFRGIHLCLKKKL